MMAASLFSKIALEPAKGSGGDLSGPSKRSGDYLAELYKRARFRRTEPSSSDSSDAGEFLVSSVKFRVAAPPAWPRPVVNRWNDDCKLIRDVLGNALEDGVNNILSTNNLKPVESGELVFRAVEGHDTRGQPTILVVATWDETSPAAWERAVKQAKRFIDEKALAHGLQHLDIAVEMIAEELTWDMYISPVPERELSPWLVQDWNCIRENVSSIFETNEVTKGKVSTISLFKLGFSANLDINPLTVYVSVDYESEEAKWPPIVEQVQHFLDSYPHKFHLHMEHGGPQMYPTFDLLLKPMTADEQATKEGLNYSLDRTYQITVGLGEDIGPARYITRNDGEKVMPGLGTLGCWVEIKTLGATEWTRCALTNYHVIRPALEGFRLAVKSDTKSGLAAPAKGSDLWKADLHGIYPVANFTSRMWEIEHPARSKHCFAVEFWRREIARTGPKNRNPDDEKYLADITRFFDDGNQRLGTVYAASGFTRRSPDNGRMDWALIKPLDTRRIGSNTIPTRKEWLQKTPHAPLHWATGKNIQQPPVAGSSFIPGGETIFKKGASTGPTAGMFSRLKTDVTLKDDAHLEEVMGTDKYHHSQEFLFVGCPGTEWLAKTGDSGSVVFNEEGRAVGLLFRGHKAQQGPDTWAYITPIQDIFADIKEFSKGGITDIRIAEYP